MNFSYRFIFGTLELFMNVTLQAQILTDPDLSPYKNPISTSLTHKGPIYGTMLQSFLTVTIENNFPPSDCLMLFDKNPVVYSVPLNGHKRFNAVTLQLEPLAAKAHPKEEAFTSRKRRHSLLIFSLPSVPHLCGLSPCGAY